MASEEPEIVRFAQLVKLMRAAQLRVLRDKDRSPKAIAAVRDLERRCDKAIGWVLSNRQCELFEGKGKRQGDGPYQRRGNR